MGNVTVIGGQWGDEGKGKVIDWLANRADVVVRFQGGNNAGHTIVVGDKTYKLSLLPSGVVQGKLSIIGNGVVVDPWSLMDEIDRARSQGLDLAAYVDAGVPRLIEGDAVRLRERRIGITRFQRGLGGLTDTAKSVNGVLANLGVAVSVAGLTAMVKSAIDTTVMPNWRMTSICLRNFEVRMRIAVSGAVSEKSW